MVNSLTRNKYFVIAILALAFAMRLVVINQSLWLDEAIGALAVRDFTFSEIITDFLKSDNHPPLYYLDLKTWTSVFGFSELTLRFHSLLYGVLTVFITYLIAKKLVKGKNKLFPILSSLLLATSQIHIYYSQEARMYSMAAFLATLTFYSFLFLVGKREANNHYWILFSFSITALVFTDYVPIFLLPVFLVAGIINKKDKKWWFKYLLSHTPILILGVFWLPTLLIQAERGKWLLTKLPGWRDIAGGANLKQAGLVWMKYVFGRISLMNKKLYYSLVLLASIPVLLSMYNTFKHRDKKFNLIWLWLALPLTLGFIASFWFPAFIYFRFLYVLPAFYLLIARGVTRIKPKGYRNFLVATLLVFNVVSWFIYITDERQQREQWRQAVGFIEANAGSKDVVIFEFPEPFAPYRWYAKGSVKAVGVTNSISADKDETVGKTQRTTAGKSGVYYFEYLRDLSDPQGFVEETLRNSGYGVSEVFDLFPGVGQVFYWTK